MYVQWYYMEPLYNRILPVHQQSTEYRVQSTELSLLWILTLGNGPKRVPKNRITKMTIPDDIKPTSWVLPPVASCRTVRLRAPAVGKLPKKAPPRFMTPYARNSCGGHEVLETNIHIIIILWDVVCVCTRGWGEGGSLIRLKKLDVNAQNFPTVHAS